MSITQKLGSNRNLLSGMTAPEGWGCEFLGEIWAGKILDPNTT
jgi:hypothetical protein